MARQLSFYHYCFQSHRCRYHVRSMVKFNWLFNINNCAALNCCSRYKKIWSNRVHRQFNCQLEKKKNARSELAFIQHEPHGYANEKTTCGAAKWNNVIISEVTLSVQLFLSLSCFRFGLDGLMPSATGNFQWTVNDHPNNVCHAAHN